MKRCRVEDRLINKNDEDVVKALKGWLTLEWVFAYLRVAPLVRIMLV